MARIRALFSLFKTNHLLELPQSPPVPLEVASLAHIHVVQDWDVRVRVLDGTAFLALCHCHSGITSPHA